MPCPFSGGGRASRFRKILSTRAGSHHSIPESVTAITVEGRPAVVSQAASTLLPSTPQSSWGLSDNVVSAERALVSNSSPEPWLQLAGRSGIAVDGVWGSVAHSFSDVPTGAGGHGNCPVWVAVPDPVLGSVVTAGHFFGRLSTTADDVGSVAVGRTAARDEAAVAANDDGPPTAKAAAPMTTATTTWTPGPRV